VHVQTLLDLGAHLRRPRLRAEDADLQRRRARVDALALHLVEDREHVGGRHHDDLGREVADELHLALGQAARDRDDRAAEPLGAVVGAQAAGEEAIAVGDVDDHAAAPACGADRAGHDVGPGVDVASGVADHRRLARRAAGRVDPHDLVAWHREHLEGIVVAQVLLAGEGKLRQVSEGPAVVGVHAMRVEGPAVERDVVVGVLEAPLQPFELQRGELVTRGGLDRIELRAVRCKVAHADIVAPTHPPPNGRAPARPRAPQWRARVWA
jgi:hypothetical protein